MGHKHTDDDEYYIEIEHGVSELGPSRSAKKRASTAQQGQGEALASLPAGALATVPLPKDLLGAINDWKGMKKHEARRRQMQYIGRLMRELSDDEEAAIADALAAILEARQKNATDFKAVEALRDALLVTKDPEAMIKKIAADYPNVDVKTLRGLVNGARNGMVGGGRKLFRFLTENCDLKG